MPSRVPHTARLRIRTSEAKSKSGYHTATIAFLEWRDGPAEWEAVDSSLLNEWGIIHFWGFVGWRDDQVAAARDFLEQEGLAGLLEE